MTERAFGLDLSANNGKPDWDIIAAHQPRPVFVGLRASISWGYRDKWFPFNWTEAKRVGILRLAYHVLYPDQDAKRQIDNFVGALSGDAGELPCVLDCELDRGQTKERITFSIQSCAAIIQTQTGRKPILYSRASWVDQFTLLGSWRNDYDWWLANYLFQPGTEHPGPPALPSGVLTWLIHQTSDSMPSFGTPEAKELDFDRWNGTEADVYRYANLQPPPPALTLEERVQRLEIEARAHGWNIET